MRCRAPPAALRGCAPDRVGRHRDVNHKVCAAGHREPSRGVLWPLLCYTLPTASPSSPDRLCYPSLKVCGNSPSAEPSEPLLPTVVTRVARDPERRNSRCTGRPYVLWGVIVLVHECDLCLDDGGVQRRPRSLGKGRMQPAARCVLSSGEAGRMSCGTLSLKSVALFRLTLHSHSLSPSYLPPCVRAIMLRVRGYMGL
jgi:hypothetical protein